VATSGKSAIIDPSGRTLAESGPLFIADTLLTTVPLSEQTTLATRTGAAAEWLLVAVAVLAMLMAGVGLRRRGQPPAEPGTAEPGPAESGPAESGTAEPSVTAPNAAEPNHRQPADEPIELTGKGRG